MSPLPPFHFTTALEVRYSDLDPQGHLNNAKYFTFMEHGRLKYCLAVGLLDPAAGFMGQGQIVAEATCTFKRPARLGEIVDIDVRIASIGNKSAVMEYQLRVGAEVVATGRTIQVAFNYDTNQSIPFPAEWRAKINAFEQNEV
jgi:acyl-CoA thioester hydrolase